LLKRLASFERGVLVGNSSAGLIEAAAVGVRVINVGPRQSGRERPANVLDVPEGEISSLPERFEAAVAAGPIGREHPYGDGQSARRISAILAGEQDGIPPIDPRDPGLIRKHNTY